MIPLVTVAQMQEIESSSGVDEDQLMFRAGSAIAERIAGSRESGSSAIVLAGPGKNGGDGIVIAALLASAGWSVSIWTFAREGIGSVPIDESDLESVHWIASSSDLAHQLEHVDVVVDSIFGAGGRASLPDEVAEVFQSVTEAQKERHLDVWAVDLPSGMEADSGQIAEDALQADITAMIGLPKIGAYQFPAAAYTGYLLYIDIGLNASEGFDAHTPQLITSLGVRRQLPRRRSGIHKRSAGTLMVVGGAPSYYGAPRLTGEAALRSGAGLVTIAAPSSIIAPMATAVPELTFAPLPTTDHASAAQRMATIVRERAEQVDAYVIGPGLSTDAPVPAFLGQLFGLDVQQRAGIGFGTHADAEETEPFAGKAVIDADGLNWLSMCDEWWTKLPDATLVLTPHAGELARLIDVERAAVENDPWTHAREAARKFGHVVVLKYGHTIVATPDGQLFVADQAPTSLATAGTGDVLAGIVGTFLAQGCLPVEAATSAILLGLRATALAEESLGTVGITASDIIHSIPRARDEVMQAQSPFE